MNGRFNFEKYGSKMYMLNTVPTMIQEGNKKFLVFSHTPIKFNNKGSKSVDDEYRFYGGPALYFYDLDMGRELYRLKGGEGLISYNDAKKTKYNDWK